MKRIVWLALLVALQLCLSLGEFTPEDALANGLRLIEFSEDVRAWVDEDEIQELINAKVHFMDVTDQPDLEAESVLSSPTLPAILVPRGSDDLEEMMKQVSPDHIGKTIAELSALHTRYYTSSTGVEAARILHAKYASFGAEDSAVSVRFFEHTWAQPSVIARIEGNDANAKEVVIIGGHEDSVGSTSTARAPGADDDASGTSAVLEVFRVLTKNGFRGNRSIEFHAYAAEEVGLRGSQAIASTYKKEGRIVAGMMQLDMAGYIYQNKPRFALVVDYVSPTLTQFVRDLAKKYTDLEIVETRCGYACSDHASWNRQGYPATFPFETRMGNDNPYIHSTSDTLDKISTEHISKFAKVALAFAVELSTQ